jgi:tRNA pseudouridine synthase 10
MHPYNNMLTTYNITIKYPKYSIAYPMPILEQAQSIIGTHPDLCNHCLGRFFGKIGEGIDNDVRGIALRFAIDKSMVQSEKENDVIFITKLINIEDFNIYKESGEESEIKCTLCNNLFNELDHFVDLVLKKLDRFEFNHFLIGTKVDVDIREMEEKLWSEFNLTQMEPIKTELNREIGKRVQDLTGIPPNFDDPDIIAIVDTRYDSIELQISSLYLYGRYRKFARGIPQTKWPCKVCWGKGCPRCKNTGKMYPTSVEEIIVKEILDTAREHQHKFHGMGREDIDARMLGNGRPFVIEIVSPHKRKFDIKELENRINQHGQGIVEIEGLRYSSKEEVVAIKSACHNKTYKVRVEFRTKVTKEKLKKVVSIFTNKQIHQRTPTRVVHRRADKVRDKEVVSINIEEIGAKENWAILNITGENGIYIKELIHGDQNRTQPNLSELLETECSVKDLDVIQIHDK